MDDVGNGRTETGNSMADRYPGTRVRNQTGTWFQRYPKIRALHQTDN